jgi:hypothetical protein
MIYQLRGIAKRTEQITIGHPAKKKHLYQSGGCWYLPIEMFLKKLTMYIDRIFTCKITCRCFC